MLSGYLRRRERPNTALGASEEGRRDQGDGDQGDGKGRIKATGKGGEYGSAKGRRRGRRERAVSTAVRKGGVEGEREREQRGSCLSPQRGSSLSPQRGYPLSPQRLRRLLPERSSFAESAVFRSQSSPRSRPRARVFVPRARALWVRAGTWAVGGARGAAYSVCEACVGNAMLL